MCICMYIYIEPRFNPMERQYAGGSLAWGLSWGGLLYEHGNDSPFHTAVEKDSLIAFFSAAFSLSRLIFY